MQFYMSPVTDGKNVSSEPIPFIFLKHVKGLIFPINGMKFEHVLVKQRLINKVKVIKAKNKKKLA